jgi:hypothetical protein
VSSNISRRQSVKNLLSPYTDRSLAGADFDAAETHFCPADLNSTSTPVVRLSFR